mmetsp:Transcript_56604/g.135137  ORF Transcript_56604/g.135137 Transcript_56604/m.135137 type:complete len:121 (-) Transcript_56604:107-469(-)
MLVSDLSKCLKSKMSTTVRADSGKGPYGGKSCFVSMWKDMHGACNPCKKSGTNANASKLTAMANPRSPRCRSATGAIGTDFRDLACGSGTPKDETVAVTTKVLKQEKPISSLALDRISGS